MSLSFLFVTKEDACGTTILLRCMNPGGEVPHPALQSLRSCTYTKQ
jgi:hypothetical protein